MGAWPKVYALSIHSARFYDDLATTGTLVYKFINAESNHFRMARLS